MSILLQWSPPPTEVCLLDDEIHIWRAPLDLEPQLVHQLNTYLTSDELARAARFKFDQDRLRFIAARGILRVVLGTYLHQKPASLVFSYGPHGKPTLQPIDAHNTLHFNLSHSHGVALYAVAKTRVVGIDIEALRSKSDWEDIAQRFFSHGEYLEILAQPEAARFKAFFQCWTHKEAYIKARGLGMTIPLNSFEVSFTANSLNGLRSADSDRWSLRGLEPAPGYTGAVVGEGQNWHLQCWSWMGWQPGNPASR